MEGEIGKPVWRVNIGTTAVLPTVLPTVLSAERQKSLTDGMRLIDRKMVA